MEPLSTDVVLSVQKSPKTDNAIEGSLPNKNF